MIELPDDELDKLFRKSSEELDPNYEPADWSALSKRLDQEDGRTPAALFRKWWPLGLLVLMLPVGLGSYFLLKNADSDKNALSKNNKSVVIAPKSGENVVSDNKQAVKDLNKNSETIAKSSLKPDVESDDEVAREKTDVLAESKGDDKKVVEGLPGTDLDNAATENPTDKNFITKSNKLKEPDNSVSGDSKKLPRSRSKTGGVYLEPNRSKGKGGEGAFSSFDTKNIITKKGKIALNELKDSQLEINGLQKTIDNTNTKTTNPDYESSAIRANEINNATEDPVNVNTVLVQEENRMLLSVAYLNHLPFNSKGILLLPAVKSAEPVTESSAESPKPAKQKELTPKMAIRFGYSPDMSSVGLKNFTKPGSAVSLMVEYAMFSRFYLQAGVVGSVKKYNANAGEYAWPSDWKQDVYPTNIDGTCKILEIPLNLRYDISQNDRSRWFAGAGFSSYYMGNEKYNYYYKPHTYGKVWRDYETKTGWYLLSHVNASAGYEYRISKKLSLLAEPYVKIPVKKVGYGKVDLFTTGVWISVRYTPVFNKNFNYFTRNNFSCTNQLFHL